MLEGGGTGSEWVRAAARHLIQVKTGVKRYLARKDERKCKYIKNERGREEKSESKRDLPMIRRRKNGV